jgi:hypothetical protein
MADTKPKLLVCRIFGRRRGIVPGPSICAVHALVNATAISGSEIDRSRVLPVHCHLISPMVAYAFVRLNPSCTMVLTGPEVCIRVLDQGSRHPWDLDKEAKRCRGCDRFSPCVAPVTAALKAGGRASVKTKRVRYIDKDRFDIPCRGYLGPGSAAVRAGVQECHVIRSRGPGYQVDSLRIGCRYGKGTKVHTSNLAFRRPCCAAVGRNEKCGASCTVKGPFRHRVGG